MSSVMFQGHTGQKKIIDFDPNWAFPGCNSSLNPLVAMKWCTMLEAAQKRCRIVFQGHLANLKVTQDKKKSTIFDARVMGFRAVTQVWIQWWLRNNAQSLMWCRRGALLFFKVIHQISRSLETQKSPILTRIERFRTVTPVWIHRWFWNDTQSLM